MSGPLLLVTGSALGAVAMVAGVVGVVFLTTGRVGALVEAAPEFGRPAREDTPDGPIVGSAELLAVIPGVRGPVVTQNVCQGQ